MLERVIGRYDHLTPGQRDAFKRVLTSGRNSRRKANASKGPPLPGRGRGGANEERGYPEPDPPSFLPDSRNLDGREVWIVDESSTVESRRMHRLITSAEKSQARFVLVGNARQLQALDVGRMFRMLRQNGIKTVWMTETVRQK
jgi:hypothetical protein